MNLPLLPLFVRRVARCGLLLSALLALVPPALRAQVTPPAWWTTQHALAGLPTDPEATLTVAQLNAFFAAAVRELDTQLADVGGAGGDLHAAVAPVLHGEYLDSYEGGSVTTLVAWRDDVVDFNWGDGPPHPALSTDAFSARWSGSFYVVASGNYTLVRRADGPVDLTVDGNLVIEDSWPGGNSYDPNSTATLWLAAGAHAITLDYVHQSGDAYVHWAVLPANNAQLPDWASMPPGPASGNNNGVAVGGGGVVGDPGSTYGINHGLRAEYFDNPLDGSLVAARREESPNFDWVNGLGSRPDELFNDWLAIRWTGTLNVAEERAYSFNLQTPGGRRLWVDGTLVDGYWNGEAGEGSNPLWLAAGGHSFQLEFQNPGEASASLSLGWDGGSLQFWDPNEVGGVGSAATLHGEYFANGSFAGNPVFVRDEIAGFDSGPGSPDPALPADDFSVRWTGRFQVDAEGDYVLLSQGTHGQLNVAVDGDLVAYPSQGEYQSNRIHLTAGSHAIQLAYAADIPGGRTQDHIVHWLLVRAPDETTFDCTNLPASPNATLGDLRRLAGLVSARLLAAGYEDYLEDVEGEDDAPLLASQVKTTGNVAITPNYAQASTYFKLRNDTNIFKGWDSTGNAPWTSVGVSATNSWVQVVIPAETNLDS